MKKLLRDDTIVTISTGLKEKAAIGIIRISGSIDFIQLESFLNLNKNVIKPRYCHYTKFTNDRGELFDEGLVFYFATPHSYTGEDVLELHVHGNPIQMERMQRYLIHRFGYKLAFPGEFTYRAFRNKKLTIAQIEGLDLILNSDSALAIDSGLSVLNGELFANYGELRECFLKLSAALEMAIDFAEDIGEEKAEQELKFAYHQFGSKLKELYQGCQGQLSPLVTPSIVLFGKTNAGKSTLFNKLLGNDRAIVSDKEGTTRDYISEHYYVEGHPFKIVDTAGLRETTDSIEREGISRTYELLKSSFYKIYVCNPFEEDPSTIDQKDYDCFLFTHGDRLGYETFLNEIRTTFDKKLCFSSSQNGPIEPLTDIHLGPIGPNIGEKNGPIEPLNQEIWSKYLKIKEKKRIDVPRQREVLIQIYRHWQTVDCNINELGVFSMEMQEMKSRLDELIGSHGADDVLNHIFNNFCIGK